MMEYVLAGVGALMFFVGMLKLGRNEKSIIGGILLLGGAALALVMAGKDIV